MTQHLVVTAIDLPRWPGRLAHAKEKPERFYWMKRTNHTARERKRGKAKKRKAKNQLIMIYRVNSVH